MQFDERQTLIKPAASTRAGAFDRFASGDLDASLARTDAERLGDVRTIVSKSM
jgi:hypothetical protein